MSEAAELDGHLAISDSQNFGLNEAGAEWADKQASKDAFLRFWQMAANEPRLWPRYAADISATRAARVVRVRA